MVEECMKNISKNDPKYANFFAIKYDCSLNQMSKKQNNNYFDNEIENTEKQRKFKQNSIKSMFVPKIDLSALDQTK